MIYGQSKVAIGKLKYNLCLFEVDVEVGDLRRETALWFTLAKLRAQRA